MNTVHIPSATIAEAAPLQIDRAGGVYRFGLLPGMASGLMIIFSVGRIMEIFPRLQPLHLGMVSITLALGFTLFSGRLGPAIFAGRFGVRLFFAFALTALLTVPFAVWPGGAAKIWWGCFTLDTILLLVLIANMRSREEVQHMSGYFMACVALLAVGISIFPAQVIVETGDILRYGASDMYDPNDLALILVVGIPIGLAHFFHAQRVIKPAWLALIILMGIGVLRTASRGGFIGLAIVGALFAVTRTSRISRWIKVALILVAIGAIFLASPSQLWRRMGAVFDGNDYNLQTSGEVEAAPGRLLIWSNAAHLLTPKTAMLGVGIGQFATAMGEKYGRFFYMTAHNTFIQVLGETGIVGLVVFCIILGAVWRNCAVAAILFERMGESRFIADLPRYIILSLAGFLVCSQFLSRGYSSLVPILLAYSIALRTIAQNEAFGGSP
jgi:O-antigen ligase